MWRSSVRSRVETVGSPKAGGFGLEMSGFVLSKRFGWVFDHSRVTERWFGLRPLNRQTARR